MVRAGWLLASLLFALPLSGCIGDPPEPAPAAATEASGTFAKGDHFAFTFEGTGWFLGTWQATEHLNVKFSLAHDAVDDWCWSTRAPDPVHVGGAFTAVAAFRADTAPRESGATFARIGQGEEHQLTSTINMLREDCQTSEVFVALPGQSVSLLVATSVPGLRVSLFDLRADGSTQNLTVPLVAHAGLTAMEPTATDEGGPDLIVARAQSTTEWRETIEVDAHWLLGFYWRDATPLVPDPTGLLGHPGHSVDRHWFRLQPVGESGDAEAPNSGGGGIGGSSGPRGRVHEIVTSEHGTWDLVMEVTETSWGSMDHKEGAWFVTIPYTEA